MNYPFEIFLGLRYLRSKRKRGAISVLTWLSILCVAIGVAALNVVLPVMNGFDEDLKSKIVGLNAHVIVTGFQNHPIPDYDSVVHALKTLDHVTSVGPYVSGQVLARSRERSTGVQIWGLDPDAPQAVADLNKYLWDVKATALKPPAGEGSGREERIFLGSELAHRLQVGPGDDLVLFMPILQPTPLGMMPRSMKFQVVGLLSTGMYDYDSYNGYVTLPMAQKMYQLGDTATGVAVKLDNVDLAPQVAKAIRDKFNGKYLVQDWLDLNHNLFVALHMEKIVMGIILSLIVLVAAISIVSSMTMVVIDKTKEIGILKAMGSTNKSIMGMFVFQGMMICTLGIILGIFWGFVICEIIAVYPIHIPGGGSVYYIDRLPVKVEPLVCYFVVPVVSIVLCFLATLYPAGQAAEMEPVEAIRYS